MVIGSEGGGVPAGAGRLPTTLKIPMRDRCESSTPPWRRRGALGGLALSCAAPSDGPTSVGTRSWRGTEQNRNRKEAIPVAALIQYLLWLTWEGLRPETAVGAGAPVRHRRGGLLRRPREYELFVE